MLRKVLFLSLIVIVLISIGCNRDKKKAKDVKAEKLVPVEVIKVKKGDISSHISATGTIYPFQEANVGPRISGRIERIFADEGDWVEGGQILIRLERRELMIAKEQTEAALDTAEASLKRLLAGTREEEIKEVEAGFAMAEANLENADLEFRRYKELYEKHAVAKKAYDIAETQYKVSVAAFNEAKERLKKARKGPTEEDREVARAHVRQAKVDVEMAKQRLEDSITRAPFSGFVVRKFKNEGEYVTATPATPVLKMVDVSKVKVEVGVAENDMVRVKKGKRAEVVVDAYPDRSFIGEVTVVNPSVDLESRTFRARTEIPNKDGLLKDGMFARVKIVAEEHKGVNIVPRDAIIEAPDYKFVFVVSDRTAYKKRITTGLSQGDQVEVTGGLNPGDNIVSAGQHALKDGAPVNIVKGGNGP